MGANFQEQLIECHLEVQEKIQNVKITCLGFLPRFRIKPKPLLVGATIWQGIFMIVDFSSTRLVEIINSLFVFGAIIFHFV